MTTDEEEEKILSLARIASRRYARRVWWADPQELFQVAVAAQLEALPRFDPTRGVEKGAYLWRTAILSIRRSVWQESAPVTHHHRLEKLAGLVRTPLVEGSMVASPTHDLEQRDVSRRIRERIAGLVGEKAARYALLVITKEWTASECAEHNRVHVREVYRTTRHLKEKLRSDSELRDFWKKL